MILNAIKTKMIGQMNAHIANIEVMLRILLVQEIEQL
jgi:hypothetical protein